jgi:hypothetical protein
MLCNQSPGAVPAIYPALINYRIALLALRDIKSLGEQALESISVRLKQAARMSEFGPWPLLYRMVVLKKLKSRDELRSVFSDAVHFVSHHSGLSRSISEGENSDLDYPAIAQSHIFNALELATFFCELEYSPLTGLLDSFIGTSNSFAPGISAEALDWSMIYYENGACSHRTMEQPFIESQSRSYFEDASGRGNKVLLLCIDLDGKIDQKRSRCTDPLHLRKWTPDVKTDSLISVLQSAEARNTTDRDHRARLKHLFSDSISFGSSGATLINNSTLIVTVKSSLWASY